MSGYRAWAARGFGLIELMIAMTISIVIGIAITQIFLTQKTTFKVQDELGRMQENARFAFDRIARDLRMSGYWSCDPKSANNMNATSPVNHNFDYSNALADDFSTTPKLVDGTDLRINFVDTSKKIKFTGVSVNTNDPAYLTPNMVKVASDCSSSYVFTGNTIGPLSYPWRNEEEVFPLEVATYKKIGDGLYRITLADPDVGGSNSNTNIIDSGVKNIEFAFGKAGTDGYVTAYESDVPNLSNWTKASWQSVASVQVTLTLQGKNVTMAPKAFTSVITIRNRLP